MSTRIYDFSDSTDKPTFIDFLDLKLHTKIYECIDEVTDKLSVSKEDALFYFANIFADDFSYGRDFLNMYFDFIQNEVREHLNGTECKSPESMSVFTSYSPEEASRVFNFISNQEMKIALHDIPTNHLRALRVSGLLNNPEEFGSLYCKYPFSDVTPFIMHSRKDDGGFNIKYQFEYNPLNAKFAYDVASQIDCIKLDIDSSPTISVGDQFFGLFYYVEDLFYEYLLGQDRPTISNEDLKPSFPEFYDPEFEGEEITIDISACNPTETAISSSYCFEGSE